MLRNAIFVFALLWAGAASAQLSNSSPMVPNTPPATGSQVGIPSVKDFGATGNTATYSDGAITGTQNAFCSAGLASFSTGDIGKSILIHGAGTAGAAFQTTISGFTSLHCVTLTANAVTTVSGASFSYGSDDTAAIQAGITSVSNTGSCLYFPAGAYWLASQTTAITLQSACLRGVGQTQSKLPYTNQGSVLVITNVTSAEFTIGSGVTIDSMGFYYPAQDGSASTPVTYPALLTGSAIFDFQFLNNYVVNAYWLLQTTDGGGSAIGRAYFHNNRIYAVDTAFYFQGGAADEIAIDSTNIISPGVFQDVAAVGSKNLANYTNTTGAVYKIDIGTAAKASIDTLNITGAFHYAYRYGIRVLSGLLNNSAIVGAHWDAIPTVLSVEGTTGKTDGLTFSGNWVYSLETFGSSPAAAAFNTISYTTSVNAGRVTFTGNHFTFSQANFIHVNAAALNSIEISGNTFAAWGQSTTTSTYYAIVCSDSNLTCSIGSNMFAAQTVVGSFLIGVDIVSKNQANITGNTFSNAFYAIQDVSSSTKTNVVGNMVNGTVSSNAVNNGVTGTASILGCGNSFDKAPNVALSSGC